MKAKQGLLLKQSQELKLTPLLKQRLDILSYGQDKLDDILQEALLDNAMLELSDSDDGLTDTSNEFESIVDYDNSDPYFGIEDTPSFEQVFLTSISLSGLNDAEALPFIIDALDEHYLLTKTNEQIAKEAKVSVSVVSDLVEKIKQLEPYGVGCKTSTEYMRLQLSFYLDDPICCLADQVLRDYSAYLNDKPELIKKRLQMNDKMFSEVMLILSGLSPYPNYSDDVSLRTIKPDIYVKEKMGIYFPVMVKTKWQGLRINQAYKSVLNTLSGDEATFLKAQYQNASALIDSLEKRESTLEKIAKLLVLTQQSFFIEGEQSIKPLKLVDVAQNLDVALSTVSRAVSDKYLLFSGKLYPLRYFFSQAVSDDSELSTTAIKAKIKDLIDHENKKKPLSDSALEKLLKDEGVDIARRTIAKYRDSLGISGASERKRKN